MSRWWLRTAIVWAVLFLIPLTRPLAVRFLPLGEAWDDILVLVATSILATANLALFVMRERDRRRAKTIERERDIRRLEHELFDE